MGMEVVAGRNFLKNSVSDRQSAFLINEAAAKKYDLQDLSGLRIASDALEKPKEGEIVGIVKNFHLKSLHHPIDPLILTMPPASYYLDNFVVRLESANIQQTLQNFSERWSAVAPERPFEYFFLDEAFADLYQRETRMSSLLTYFTLLALFVACMGMFALAAFATERRTKEIGIRKVLGATTSNIATLLSRDFLKLVLIAAVIAFPVAWWIMSRWLESFAYRIEMQWWMFLLAGVAAFVIAILTVGYQSLRAAVANPVDSIKTE
jgi:putative ABC transport system permease protein